VGKKEFGCLLISDFTINNFAGYLDNDKSLPAVRSVIPPFDQAVRVLTDSSLECWKSEPDFAVVWTRPDSVIESFCELTRYRNVPIEEIFKEVDSYSSLLLDIRNRVKSVFVITWTFPSYHRGFGMLDMKAGTGISNALMRMNIKLSENLDQASNIHILNAERWVNIAGKNAFNPKLWYMGKIAFSNEVFVEATKDLKSALRGIIGGSRKLVVLDLDETLWGGIVGDVGWQNIRLGGHDPIGEAFVDFQNTLKSLLRRGILLAIASKNEEEVALKAIKSHPEMVLKLDDFVSWRINWQDKAQNIVDMASELKLGFQSMVYIDDDPVERARIKETLPEVFVPDWPEDKMLYASTLLSLHCFDYPSISKEDVARTEMYAFERQRQDLRKKIGSFDEWLKRLEISVEIEELNEASLQRAAQLLNKTNQMNLTTRRMTEDELMAWAKEDNHKLWTFRARDRLSDSGLTGLVSLEFENTKTRIVDFVLSCRVMGRKIEEIMVHKAISHARASLSGVGLVWAKYVPTPKNKPCFNFWKSSGFKFSKKDNSFSWDAKKDFKPPEYIEIIEG